MLYLIVFLMGVALSSMFRFAIRWVDFQLEKLEDTVREMDREREEVEKIYRKEMGKSPNTLQ